MSVVFSSARGRGYGQEPPNSGLSLYIPTPRIFSGLTMSIHYVKVVIMERNEWLQIRVSGSEKREAERKAKGIGMKVSEFVRKLIEEWKPK